MWTWHARISLRSQSQYMPKMYILQMASRPLYFYYLLLLLLKLFGHSTSLSHISEEVFIYNQSNMIQSNRIHM